MHAQSRCNLQMSRSLIAWLPRRYAPMARLETPETIELAESLDRLTDAVPPRPLVKQKPLPVLQRALSLWVLGAVLALGMLAISGGGTRRPDEPTYDTLEPTLLPPPPSPSPSPSPLPTPPSSSPSPSPSPTSPSMVSPSPCYNAWAGCERKQARCSQPWVLAQCPVTCGACTRPPSSPPPPASVHDLFFARHRPINVSEPSFNGYHFFALVRTAEHVGPSSSMDASLCDMLSC